MKESRIPQDPGVALPHSKCNLMPLEILLGEDLEGDATKSRGTADKTLVNNFRRQADCFEYLGSFVRLQGRYSHLSHHFGDAWGKLGKDLHGDVRTSLIYHPHQLHYSTEYSNPHLFQLQQHNCRTQCRR